MLFGVTIDGYTQLRSKEIAGDVHSLAWGPNGHNLHALNSRASSDSVTSVVNYRISDDPNLEDILRTDFLANVSDASQIVAHPVGDRIYVVTKDANELVTVALEADGLSIKAASTPSRYKLLPSSLDSTKFRTSSLAISASKSTLWTLSQSANQAVIVAFTLNPATGEVIDAAARASWGGAGDGQLTAALFEASDVVAISNSPLGYLTLLGLDQNALGSAQDLESNSSHEYLEEIKMPNRQTGQGYPAAFKVKSYGRIPLDEFVAMGESVWVD